MEGSPWLSPSPLTISSTIPIPNPSNYFCLSAMHKPVLHSDPGSLVWMRTAVFKNHFITERSLCSLWGELQFQWRHRQAFPFRQQIPASLLKRCIPHEERSTAEQPYSKLRAELNTGSEKCQQKPKKLTKQPYQVRIYKLQSYIYYKRLLFQGIITRLEILFNTTNCTFKIKKGW